MQTIKSRNKKNKRTLLYHSSIKKHIDEGFFLASKFGSGTLCYFEKRWEIRYKKSRRQKQKKIDKNLKESTKSYTRRKVNQKKHLIENQDKVGYAVLI